MENIIFNENECDYVKSFYNNNIPIDAREPLVVNIGNDRTVSIKRKARANYIDCYDKSLISFILKKINHLNIKSITNEGVKIVKYSQGDYFEKHTDFNKYGKGATYKTLVIQLSNPTDYVGGDLLVKDIPQTRELGSYSLFLSSDVHEVTKLISGERYSLTIFLTESDFTHKQTLI